MSASNTPWLQDADVTLYHGDVLSVLPELPAESVDCVVTSPPYWGLRDYGTGAWEGGDVECDHLGVPFRTKSKLNENWGAGFSDVKNTEDREPMGQTCSKCGATRIDQQLGLEPTPEQYVERMVEVFREVRRVLAPHGTCWVNLGDSYASSPKGNPNALSSGLTNSGRHQAATSAHRTRSTVVSGLKPKDLVGIPWRVAFALQADGWYLRSDIIWSKPNPMPESVTDRPTKAHEYLFLLSKQPRYFFDQEAVREENTEGNILDAMRRKSPVGKSSGNGETACGFGGAARVGDVGSGRNIRSVWKIATQPYPEAHFATFPEELARRCIAAGCPERGTVLDPFIGSGTVAYVARKLGRNAVGIDLSESYLELAARRLQQQSLFAEAASGL